MRAIRILICGCAVSLISACSEGEPPSGDPATVKTEISATPNVAPAKPKPTLPNHPLRGTVNTMPMENFKASFENGILTLYTGDDPNFDYGLRLILFFVLEEAANQSISIDTAKAMQSANIHVNSKTDKTLDSIISKPIKIALESGAEKDFRVPVRMHLEAGDKVKIKLDGQFEIATSGLRAEEGVVDLSHDHLDTITYVARSYIEDQNPGKKVEYADVQVNWFQNAPKKKQPDSAPQEGGYSVTYQIDGGPLQISKMQLLKKDDTWQVVNVIGEHQLYEAHKLNPLFRDAPPYIFSPMAARHFEEHYYQTEGGWQQLKEPMHISCGGGQVEGQPGYCNVNYGKYFQGDFKINGSYTQVKCTTKTYLFKPEGEGWVIDQVLPAEKKFNLKKQVIEDREGDIWGC